MFDGMPGPDDAGGPALPTKPLSELCTFRGGGTPSKSNPAFWTDGTIPWVSPKDMKSDVIRDAEDKITQAAVEKSATNVVPEGAILVVTRSGILKHTLPVGVTALPVALNQDLKALVPKKGTDADFIAWFLRSRQHDILANCTKDGTTVASVDTKKLKDYPVPFLPLTAQRRIVSRIEELYSQVEAGERAIGDARRDLARYRRSILHAAVTGALTEDWREANPDPAEDGPALLARLAEERRAAWERAELAKLDAKGKPRPKTDKQWATFRGRYKAPDPASDSAPVSSWVVATIDSLTQSFSNGLSQKPADHETEYPILRISAVRRMSVATDDVRFYEPRANENIDVAWVQANDLLFTRYNGSAELVGVCGRFQSSAPVLHPDKLMKAVPIGRDAALSRWLEIAANAGMTAARIGDWVKTSAGQHGIAGSDVKAAPVPLPPAAEQAEIVSRIDEAFSRADAAEATLDAQARAARGLKQSILKAAFAGQLA